MLQMKQIYEKKISAKKNQIFFFLKIIVIISYISQMNEYILDKHTMYMHIQLVFFSLSIDIIII